MVTGLIIIIAGAYVAGAVIFLLAAFVGFTYSGVELDTESRKVKQYNKLFGIIKTGRWEPLETYIGLTLIPFSTVEAMASWSNRITSGRTTDYRIFFVNRERKPAFVIKKCKSEETARNSMDEFSLWLRLPVYSIRK